MKIFLKHGTIGPAHDPYGYEELAVSNDGHVANYRMCGLRGDELFLYEGNELVRHFKVREKTADMTKLSLLFKRWVGITPEEAREREEANEDNRAADRAELKKLVAELGWEKALQQHYGLQESIAYWSNPRNFE